MRSILLNSSACPILAMVIAMPAFAQATQAVVGQQPAPAASAPDAEQQPTGLEEIVVTAERFSEKAQKAPVVISVLRPSQLIGVTDVQQLQTIEPGIQLGGAGVAVQTFIRGVGTLTTSPIQESAVSYNMDGVLLYSSTMLTPRMYDLDRIEVLKGPQGTLYGRNASAGAVNFITKGASLDGMDGYIEAQLGNYDLGGVTGAVNLPITQELAIRVAGQHVEHSGYLSDGTDDQNQSSGRLRVLYEPSDIITLKFGFDGSTIDSNGPGASINPNPTSDPFIGGYDKQLASGPYALQSPAPNPAPYFRDNQWSIYGQGDFDLGFATLTVLPAYLDEALNQRNYVGGLSNMDGPLDTKETSVEARLANQTDELKWVFGGYYLNVDQNDLLHAISLQNTLQSEHKTVESYAFFGETTYNVTSELRLIGGLRYTHESTTDVGGVNILAPFPSTYSFNDATAADAVSWKVGLEYDLSPDSMLFTTVSRGFKGGGTYPDVPGASATYKPEYITAYELGSRNRFFDNSLQVNLEGFYWKLRNQQIPYLGYNSLGEVDLITANAGQAHMDGVDLDVVYKMTPNDTLSGAAEYLNSAYDSFNRQMPSIAVIPGTACGVSGFNPTNLLAPANVDCSGQAGVRAPRWSGSVAYEHRFELGSAGDINFNVNMTFATKRYLSPAYTSAVLQGSDELFNLSLTYTTADGNFALTGWVRNIGDERVMTGGDQLVPLFSRPTLGNPRTFGFTARYSF